jgi:hypothetical protein
MIYRGYSARQLLATQQHLKEQLSEISSRRPASFKGAIQQDNFSQPFIIYYKGAIQ